MIDVRESDQAIARISDAHRRFEKGGGVPNATHELLVELHDALADSGPLELGIPPRQWLRAQERMSRAVKSFGDDRIEVQISDAERGLRAARRVFRLAEWSARWRRWSGGTTRALRIQFAAVWILAGIAGAVLESVFQPGGFHLIFLAVGPIVLAFVWLALVRDTTARLSDAALGREAAEEVAGDQRALVALRLVSESPRTALELAIATDRQVIVARRVLHERWEVRWSEPYTQIERGSDETAKTRQLTLRTREGGRALKCRELRGETAQDYQGSLREVLLAILERRAAATPRI